MSDGIRQIRPGDSEIREEWTRETAGEELRGVGAFRIAGWEDKRIGWPGSGAGWYVTVPVMEFVRDEPLESELRQRVMTALRGVSGVTGVTHAAEHDREKWFLTGAVSGPALITAVAQVVDDLADRVRDYLDL
jgi:hypothetical protein